MSYINKTVFYFSFLSIIGSCGKSYEAGTTEHRGTTNIVIFVIIKKIFRMPTMNFNLKMLVLFICFIHCVSGFGKVIRVEMLSKERVLNGKVFTSGTAYELLRGKVYFEFDPANYVNSRITDIFLAERNSNGKVAAWSELVVLRPINIAKSNGVALIEVSNRGGKFTPRYFNRAEGSDLDVNKPEDFGDNFLMDEGYTVIWIGWEFDVPNSALKLNVPVARGLNDSEIVGLVRSDWTVDMDTSQLYLGHRLLESYPVARQNDLQNILTYRTGRDEERIIVPRGQWQFAAIGLTGIKESSHFIYSKEGFKAGRIYELIYVGSNPPVVGLGMAAIRDIVSYVKYDKTCEFSVRYGIAVGVSQTGRFLRQFVYQNFNTDENGRKAYDGMMVMTAGAGMGSFNHRFAQPSRDGHRYSSFLYPTDLFPFSTTTQFNNKLMRSDGLFASANKEDLPKLFFINTGYEYWGRSASLIHTSLDGQQDAPLTENERIYHIASGQHTVGQWPLIINDTKRSVKMFKGNPLYFFPNYRALFFKLTKWVTNDETPPNSTYPTIAAGTLIAHTELNMPKIPGLVTPNVLNTAYNLDFGPRWNLGIIDIQPPVRKDQYIPKVSAVDKNGNEIGGIRNVELTVPLATYTPWNLRTGFAGGNGELTDFQGTFLPFPLNEEIKDSTGDSRPAIMTLYKNKEDYIKKITIAIESLIADGFVLPRDKDDILKRSSSYWDWMITR